MYLRFYDEVDAKGNVLVGYGNKKLKYYHLPQEVRQPCEYRLAEFVLGHVRLEPLKTIGRKQVSRMYTEFVDEEESKRKYGVKNKPTDRPNLIEEYESQYM